MARGLKLAVLALAIWCQAGPVMADPISVAVGAAVFGAGTIGAQAAAVVLNVAFAVGLSFATKLLTPKPKRQSTLAAGINTSVRESLSPRRLVYGTTRTGGTIVYYRASGDDNRFLNIVIAYCEGQIDEMLTYLNDERVSTNGSDKVVTGVFQNYVYFRPHLGTASQAADGLLISEAPSDWTSNHTLSKVAYAYYRCEYEQSVFSTGLPNFSVRIRGMLIDDPRGPITRYTANPALIIRDFLLRPAELGGVGASPSEIDETNFAAQANICEESVSVPGGGTEPRYEFHGVVEIGDGNTPADTLQAMLTSCGGRLVYFEGQWKLFVAAWRSASFDITDDMIVGPISVKTRQSRAEQFNAVKGSYRPADRKWQAQDYPPMTFPEFEDEDGGERVYAELPLEFTTSASMAQRLAKIHVYRSRFAMEVTVTCSLAAYAVAVGDVVTLTHARWGFYTKEFEVMSWRWSVDRQEGGGGGLLIELVLRETASSVYNWASTDGEIVDQSGDTALPRWNMAQPPVNLAVAEQLYATTGSAGVKAQAILTWQAPTDAFVVSYEAQYKASASSTWLGLPSTSGTTLNLPDLAPGTYNFQVRSVNGVRAVSAWVQITATIVGLSAAPTTPTGMMITPLNGIALLRWDPTPDLDVKIGGSMLIRFTPNTSGVTWDNSTQVASLPGDSTSVSLPLQTGTYLLRARDSTGNLSASYASVGAVNVNATTFTTLVTLTEDPGFSGTKTNCATDGTGLKVTTPTSSAEYAFNTTMNLGSVKNCRLTTRVVAETIAAGGLIDDNTALIDTWASIDGVTGGSVLAQVYYRSTQTDPTGSPTWTAWTPVDVTDERGWGFQFKVVFSASDPAWNARILNLSAVASQP